MSDHDWQQYPNLAQNAHARTWLTIQQNLQLAPNTVAAYGRALEDYLSFCAGQALAVITASPAAISTYVNDLATRPVPRRAAASLSPAAGLSNATMQQRLTVVRLFYDYLMEEALRPDNPVGRGRFTSGRSFGGVRSRGLLPRYQKLPWIPSDDQWHAIITIVRDEPLRNRLMFVLAYDAGLRREELCALEVNAIDPAYRLLRIRAETTKNRLERIVPYSTVAGTLLAAYLQERRALSSARGPLFLSTSRRNRAQPLSIWTWSKCIAGIAQRAAVPSFTTHTLRHLCLTDLARADWDIHAIATFAGHRSIQTTLRYIHLSGRDLAQKLERGMADIHTRRLALIGEVLT